MNATCAPSSEERGEKNDGERSDGRSVLHVLTKFFKGNKAI